MGRHGPTLYTTQAAGHGTSERTERRRAAMLGITGIALFLLAATLEPRGERAADFPADIGAGIHVIDTSADRFNVFQIDSTM